MRNPKTNWLRITIVVTAMGAWQSCDDAPTPGTEGGSCTSGILCEGRLDCIDSTCRDNGSTDIVGLDPAVEKATLRANVTTIDTTSATQITAVIDATTVSLSGADALVLGDVLYSPPSASNVYGRISSISAAGTTRTATLEPITLDELYDELVVRKETEIDWSQSTITGDWASRASNVSTKADEFKQTFEHSLQIKVPEYNLIGIQATSSETSGSDTTVTGTLTGSVDLKDIEITISARIKIDIDKSSGGEVQQAWIGTRCKITTKADLAATLQGKGTLRVERALPVKASFLLLIGGVPTPVTVDIEPTVAFEMEVSADYQGKYAISREQVATVGLLYKNGSLTPSRRILEPTISIQPLATQGKVQGAVSLAMKFPFVFKLMKVLGGPTIEVTGGVKAEFGFSTLVGKAFEVFAKLFGFVEVDVLAEVDFQWFSWQFLKAKILKAEFPIGEEIKACFPDCDAACGSGGCPLDKYPDLKDSCTPCPDSPPPTTGSVGYCLHDAPAGKERVNVCDHYANTDQASLDALQTIICNGAEDTFVLGSRCPLNGEHQAGCQTVVPGVQGEQLRVYYDAPAEWLSSMADSCQQIGGTWIDPYQG